MNIVRTIYLYREPFRFPTALVNFRQYYHSIANYAGNGLVVLDANFMVLPHFEYCKTLIYVSFCGICGISAMGVLCKSHLLGSILAPFLFWYFYFDVCKFKYEFSQDLSYIYTYHSQVDRACITVML